MVTRVAGWGRATASHAQLSTPADDEEWAHLLACVGPRGLIVRGGGCAYGDAAQNAGGTVALTRGSSGIGTVDAASASVWADAGATVGALLTALAPQGWTLPVVPGTATVTV